MLIELMDFNIYVMHQIFQLYTKEIISGVDILICVKVSVIEVYIIFKKITNDY